MVFIFCIFVFEPDQPVFWSVNVLYLNLINLCLFVCLCFVFEPDQREGGPPWLGERSDGQGSLRWKSSPCMWVLCWVLCLIKWDGWQMMTTPWHDTTEGCHVPPDDITILWQSPIRDVMTLWVTLYPTRWHGRREQSVPAWASSQPASLPALSNQAAGPSKKKGHGNITLADLRLQFFCKGPKMKKRLKPS